MQTTSGSIYSPSGFLADGFIITLPSDIQLIDITGLKEQQMPPTI